MASTSPIESVTLLGEGRYLASERTLYRLLAAHGEVRERRDELTHPAYAAPELLAERPNLRVGVVGPKDVEDRVALPGVAGLASRGPAAGRAPGYRFDRERTPTSSFTVYATILATA